MIEVTRKKGRLAEDQASERASGKQNEEEKKIGNWQISFLSGELFQLRYRKKKRVGGNTFAVTEKKQEDGN